MGFYLEVPKGSQFVLGGTSYPAGEHYIENESLWMDVVSSVNAGVPVKARRDVPKTVETLGKTEDEISNEFPQPEEFTPEAPLRSADLKKVGGTTGKGKSPGRP